jgi:hypothetical protein
MSLIAVRSLMILSADFAREYSKLAVIAVLVIGSIAKELNSSLLGFVGLWLLITIVLFGMPNLVRILRGANV